MERDGKLWRRLRLGAVLAAGATGLWAGPTLTGFWEGFEHFPADGWHIAHYQFSHPAFDTDWRRDNLRADGGLHLHLTPKSATDRAENRFWGASVRRAVPSHYGRYEAVVRPARGAGIVTGFFTYTGPHYGSRHDEIDIEFLGKDTTRMQVSWFVDGVLHSHKVALGFDAAARPHRYGFEWHPDRIRWFVDSRPVFEVSAKEAPLPEKPGYLFANLWAVADNLHSWAGRPAAGTSASAYVGDVRFTPLQDLTAAATPDQTMPFAVNGL